jgi:hypothetical protein
MQKKKEYGKKNGLEHFRKKNLNRNNYNCDGKNWMEKKWNIMENTLNTV